MMKVAKYSILMDETTDLGSQKQTAILTKVWSDGEVKTLFYDMKVGLTQTWYSLAHL